MNLNHTPRQSSTGAAARLQQPASSHASFLVLIVAFLALAFGVSAANADEGSPPPLPAPPVASEPAEPLDDAIEEPVATVTDWADLEA